MRYQIVKNVVKPRFDFDSYQDAVVVEDADDLTLRLEELNAQRGVHRYTTHHWGTLGVSVALRRLAHFLSNKIRARASGWLDQPYKVIPGNKPGSGDQYATQPEVQNIKGDMQQKERITEILPRRDWITNWEKKTTQVRIVEYTHKKKKKTAEHRGLRFQDLPAYERQYTTLDVLGSEDMYVDVWTRRPPVVVEHGVACRESSQVVFEIFGVWDWLGESQYTESVARPLWLVSSGWLLGSSALTEEDLGTIALSCWFALDILCDKSVPCHGLHGRYHLRYQIILLRV